jgi:hypothetical protein
VVRLPENTNDAAGNGVESQNVKAGSLLVSSVPAGPDIALEARRRRDRIKLLLTSLTEKKGKLLGQVSGEHADQVYVEMSAEGKLGGGQ